MVWFLYIIGAVLFYGVCAKVTHPCIVLVTSLIWPFMVPICLVMAMMDKLDNALSKKGEK